MEKHNPDFSYAVVSILFLVFTIVCISASWWQLFVLSIGMYAISLSLMCITALLKEIRDNLEETRAQKLTILPQEEFDARVGEAIIRNLKNNPRFTIEKLINYETRKESKNR